MAFLGKLAQGVLGLGGLVTFPLVANNSLQQIKSVPPPARPIPPITSSPIEQLKKAGQNGCFALQGRGGTSLYACLKNLPRSKLQTTLFHYDRSITDPTKRINQIISFDFSSPKTPTMKLTNLEKNKVLKYIPFWMSSKWRSRKNINPSTECQFTKNDGTRDSYKLTCSSHTIQEKIDF